MTTTLIPKIEGFFRNFPEQKFQKGQTIISNIEPLDSIYYLKSGYVRMYLDTELGNKFTLHIFQNPALFPTMLMMSDNQSKYSFQALNQVTTFKAPASQVLDWLKNQPDVTYNMATNFARAINGLSIRLEHTIMGTAYSKVTSLLSYLTSNFGQKDHTNQIVIEPSFTHEEIASWLGLARETVSRQIEKLKSKKLIKYRGSKLIVINPEALKSEEPY